MANTRTKIERLGLHDFVLGLYANGVVSVKEIARRIKVERGEKISEDAVRNHLSTHVKPEFENAASVKIQEHVDRVVPQDLKALEEMEAQCLEWFRELPKEQAARLAHAATEIDSELDSWIKLFKEAPARKRAKVVKDIIRSCLELVNQDARQQDKRIKAIAMAVKIIEVKLGKAGVLEDDQKGRIVILDRSGDYDPSEGDAGTARRRKPLTLVMQDRGEQGEYLDHAGSEF